MGAFSFIVLFFSYFIVMVTGGCTTITWSIQSSQAKRRRLLHQRNQQRDNKLCKQKLMETHIDSRPFSSSNSAVFSITTSFSNTVRKLTENQANQVSFCRSLRWHLPWLTAESRFLGRSIYQEGDENASSIVAETIPDFHIVSAVNFLFFAVIMEDNYPIMLFLLSFQNSIDV